MTPLTRHPIIPILVLGLAVCFALATFAGALLISAHAMRREDVVSLCFVLGGLFACVGGLLLLRRGTVS